MTHDLSRYKSIQNRRLAVCWTQGSQPNFMKWGTFRQENVVSEQLQVAVGGGGIGGLTAALALRARGLNVTVFEQAGETPRVCFQRIGLGDEIEKIGSPITGQVIRRGGATANARMRENDEPFKSAACVEADCVTRSTNSTEGLKVLIPRSTLRYPHPALQGAWCVCSHSLK
jgi:hypothetical protein